MTSADNRGNIDSGLDTLEEPSDEHEEESNSEPIIEQNGGLSEL